QPVRVRRRGGYRKRLPRPEVHALERRRFAHLELERELARRRRQDLERDLRDQAQRAERARGKARDVVAGHVFHHLAAEAELPAAPVHQLHAEDEVAQRPGRSAARTRQAARHAAAERRFRPEVRRLEREALPVLLENFFQLGEERSAACRDDELGRLIAPYSRVAAGVEKLAARLVAVEVLAAAAAQAQRRLVLGGFPDTVLKRCEIQKRGSSGCGSLPPRTCMRPYSAQRASVGTALP